MRPARAAGSLVTCLALGLAVGAIGASPAGAACGRTVTGGTAAERTTVQRILCLMPGTRILRVSILGAPPDAPDDTRTLGIVVQSAHRSSPNRFAEQARAGWEADLVAGAIRDGFARKRLSRVVAYASSAGSADVDPRFYRPLARPIWRVDRWNVKGIRSLGKPQDGRWAGLAAVLRRDAARFHVTARLEQYNPFGKAPVVTIETSAPTAFFRGGALAAFRTDLGIAGHQFDGAFLSVVGAGRVLYAAFSQHRTNVTQGCAAYVPAIAGQACKTS